MVGRYEKAEMPRFAVEDAGRGRRFTVRPPHGAVRVLCLFSCFGVMSVLAVQFTRLTPALLVVPLPGTDRSTSAGLVACAIVGVVGFAVVLFITAVTLSWVLSGAEILDVAAGDLAVTHRMWGVTRTKRYRGADVVEIVEHVASPFQQNQIGLPVLWAARTGSVRLTYGARTMYLAQGLDPSEGRLLAAALRESLRAGGARRRRSTEP